MSELIEKDSVARMIGASAGYVAAARSASTTAPLHGRAAHLIAMWSAGGWAATERNSFANELLDFIHLRCVANHIPASAKCKRPSRMRDPKLFHDKNGPYCFGEILVLSR